MRIRHLFILVFIFAVLLGYCCNIGPAFVHPSEFSEGVFFWSTLGYALLMFGGIYVLDNVDPSKWWSGDGKAER